VTVFPFSFREVLAHSALLPEREWHALSKSKRSSLHQAFHRYLTEGGFPDAQQIEPRDRRPLLQGYVDVAVLRDIIERHKISNPIALRWLQRHLLGNPTAPFSIQKFYDALKSQGLSVSKNSLHSFLAYFEDAFLVRTTSLFTSSERQRMVNPRKAYPIDQGLIPIYERTGKANLGHALETAVLIELQRRGYELHYFRNPSGTEIDFHAASPSGETLLIQVCANAADPITRERELRSLLESRESHPDAQRLLLLLDPLTGPVESPKDVKILPAIEWFIEEMK
jgi:hypothetical protein